MNETTLATRTTPASQLALQAHHLAIEGLEDLTLEEDLILPRWRIVQYSSSIEGEPGHFNNNLTDQTRDYLDLVVLKITPSRAFFNDERELVCASRDGRVSTDGISCADCRHATWGPNGEPPDCSRGYTLICLDPSDDSLCLLGALRTSVPAIKRLNSLLHLKAKPPFAFVTRFSTTPVAGAKGKYFVLNAALDDENPPDDTARFRALYLSLATVRIQEVEEPARPNGFDDDWSTEELPF